MNGSRELTPENKKKLALIVALVNAKLWHDIKVNSGYSGAEMGDTVEWALSLLLNDLV